MLAKNAAVDWLTPCDGRLMPVSRYQPLYSLIGEYYGNGPTVFNAPDLSRAVPPVDGARYYIVNTGWFPPPG